MYLNIKKLAFYFNSMLLPKWPVSLNPSKMATSCVTTFSNYEKDPVETFKQLLQRLDSPAFIPMNLATIDSEFGVLNRSVNYRGLIEGDKSDTGIVFITERNTQKYKNLQENSKTSVTFLFTNILDTQNQNEIWQVRLLDAEAFELSDSQIAKYWNEEPIQAKIRSHLCECGKPTDHAQFIAKHDQLLKNYENGTFKLEQTKTYTAFKILAKRWDFYKSMPGCIADRVQYRKQSYDSSEHWNVIHVEP